MPYAEARAKRFATDWATIDIPRPAFLGTRIVSTSPSREIRQIRNPQSPHLPRRPRPLHRLVAVLPDLGAEGQVPAHLRRPAVGAEAQRLVRRRQRAARPHHRREAARGPRRLRLLAGRQRWATTSSCTPTRRAARELRALPRPPATVAAQGPGSLLLAGRLHRPARRAARQDYIGAFAVTAGIGCDELAAQLRRRSRRLQLDHGQGAGRPPGRGVRRVPARPGPPRLGLRPRREAVDRRPHRRKIPRHPPGARLPGPARPHREAHPVRPARRRREPRASSSPSRSPCTPRPA